MLQSQIHRCCQEGRGDDQRDDLHLEHAGVPGIVVHFCPSDIAEEFEEAADGHGDHEGPGLDVGVYDDLHDAQDAEDGGEEDVTGDVGTVAIGRGFDGALGGDADTIGRRHDGG